MLNTRIIFSTAVAALLLAAPGAWAQWPEYKVPGAPRLANGKVNMNAPAPKMPDGKPDFTGVWNSVDILGGPAGGPGTKPTFVPPGFGAPCQGPPASAATPDEAKKIYRAGFQNLAVQWPGCLLPYQPWALELRNRRSARNGIDSPDTYCLPLNPVWLWVHPYPRKLIQGTRELVYLGEANSATRDIFFDGRAQPKNGSVQPWWYGYSTAKWEGDTLVVETTGFNDEGWIDENGSPLTSEAHVTERIRRPNYGTLEVLVTVNDPKAYTRPFTLSMNQYLMADDELLEFICAENNTSTKHFTEK